ncbi:hypothetical protein [Luteimicrobium subarcticum]|uniref:hypothetical protein n=1 Tax=Luteimicrobium subarcticum TaxID=620910 RepID=UPI0012FD053A|nr:hypothetical protein [Luteimicrobium subarcticum]
MASTDTDGSPPAGRRRGRDVDLATLEALSRPSRVRLWDLLVVGVPPVPPRGASA